MENKKDIELKDIKQEILVPAILVNKIDTGKYLTKYKDLIIKKKKVKPVISKNSEKNLILLDPSKKSEIQKIFSKEKLETYKIIKTASDFTYQELLERILPKDKIPSSFEIIGDIAIINLRDKSQFLHKKKIGEAIILTNKHIKSIYNKFEKLDNKFRTPKLEHLAGSKKKVTTVIEQKIKIKLNISEVYYCSRLHSERERVTKYLKSFDTIADVFCGVGPFALLAAKNFRCRVLANDLNPFCYKFLKENIIVNKLGKCMESFCLDGREFIFLVFDKFLKGILKRVDHFYMNLPALAIEFLDAFVKTPKKMLEKGFFIHVYCFHEKDEDEKRFIEGLKERVRDRLGDVFCYAKFREFHFLKQVSSVKVMMCVTIWMEKEKEVIGEEGTMKKLKKE